MTTCQLLQGPRAHRGWSPAPGPAQLDSATSAAPSGSLNTKSSRLNHPWHPGSVSRLLSRATVQPSSSSEMVRPASASRRFTEQPQSSRESKAKEQPSFSPASALSPITEQPTSSLETLRPASALALFTEQPSSGLKTLRHA